MTPQTLGPAAHEFRRYLCRPACPRCGDTQFAPEASELVMRGHIRHFWSCETCGNDFVSAVQLSHMAIPVEDDLE